MHGVKLDLGLLDLNGHLHLVECLGHSLELADGVGGEASPLGAVMQHKTLGSLVIHEVGRSTDPRIGELEVLVEVVETIEEISELSAKQSKHVTIAKTLVEDPALAVDILCCTRIEQQTLQRRNPFLRKTRQRCIPRL